jgi:hypothetical protein
MDESSSNRPRFPQAFMLRLPDQIAVGIRRAADEGMTTQAEYARRAIMDRLREDGILANAGVAS